MTDDEAADLAGAIMAKAVSAAREAGLSEEMIGCGHVGAALDVAKRSGRPEHWAEIFRRYAALLDMKEGAA